MYNVICVAAGGAIGALLRYTVATAIHSFVAGMFPWGTLAVNLVGSFLAGCLWHFSEQIALDPRVKVFIFIGILGGFTTFSTYMLETLNLMRDGELVLALANMIVHTVAGIILVFAGFTAAQYCITFFK